MSLRVEERGRGEGKSDLFSRVARMKKGAETVLVSATKQLRLLRWNRLKVGKARKGKKWGGVVKAKRRTSQNKGGWRRR